MKDRFSYLDQMKDVEKAQRNSNIEMLRLISMFMILLLHANFIALGYPNTEQCCGAPVLTFTRMLMESLCIVSVNVFVLISGWFGIKFKWKNLGNIYFQCFFYGILALLFAIAVGEHVGLSMVIKQMYLGSQYWFVTSYVGLVLLSPFLNSIFTLHRQKVRVILLSLLAYVVLYGWLISDYIHISGGYTLLWFVVLYITAGYLRLSAENHTQSPKTYMGVYLMASFAGAMLAYLTARYQLPIEFSKFYNYNSPLVYIASIGLFLSFVKRPSGGGKNHKQLCHIMFGYLSRSL